MGDPAVIAPSWLVLVGLLLVAAVFDIRSRIIPNWLVGAMALLAPVHWWFSGMGLWPDVAVQVGVALLLFGLFALAFHFGMMGGGDVKLIAALALWLPLGLITPMLLIMAITGGLLTTVIVIGRKLIKSKQQNEIPYGVAIAIGGLWVIAERYLNHFA